MALPTLHWKFVGADSSLYSSVQGLIDAIYRLGQSTTYADGAVRTPGTGSAWTWVREGSDASTTAAIGAPPSVAPYTNDYDMRYIFAGNGSAAPSSILSPDTNAAAQLVGTLWMGMNRGAFTYVGPWTAAQPFGSGFSGYWHAAGTYSTRTGVFMYESEEACVVVAAQSNGATQHFLFGALTDPLSASGVEANGRLYYMQTQGYSRSLAPSFLAYTTDVAGGYGNHNTTANTSSHCGYFNPGLTTVSTAIRMERFAVFTPSIDATTTGWRATTQSGNGDTYKQAIHLLRNTGTAVWLGPMRNMWAFGGYPCASVVKNGSTVVGYTVGYTPLYPYDTVLLGA